MNVILIALIFTFSVYQTLRRGPGGAFAYVFVPVLLCLAVVRPISLSGLPDIFSPMAVSYGIIVGAVLAGRLPPMRLHPIDLVVLLCSVTVVVTGYKNGNFWTLVSATGAETLRWIVPYYAGRLAFREPPLRRRIALTLCYVAMALGAMGLVEFRLWPNFFSRLLEKLGMSQAMNDAVLPRWHFFRAMVTTEHPIDFGNVGLILCFLVPAMAAVGGVRLRDWRVRAAVLASLMIIGESISFSSIMGLAAAAALFVVLYYLRGSGALLIPLTLGAIACGFVLTQRLLNTDLDTIRPVNLDDALDGSVYVRTLIVQKSWSAYASTAGLLGYGDNNITRETLGLESVDNSYMLFLMRRGWLHLGLRLALGVMIAGMGAAMLRRCRTAAERLPVAAVTALLLGTMVSMYTVWFGFVYAVLWTIVLAMAVTMRQMLGDGQTLVVPFGWPVLPARPRGFDAMPPPRPLRPRDFGGGVMRPLATPLIAPTPPGR